jgi:DNA repair protein SbcC/Rad50
LKRIIEQIESSRIRTEQLRALEAKAREQSDVADKLGKLLAANQFEKWLVSTALKSLTATASTILERLSSNQFGLEATENNDFQVIDHYNADQRRPVKSLSGGETFQASLALALALSQEVGAINAQAERNLDSIFLDEGFGTLDPETLETVADTIETLGQDGRMVGLITHVRELAERVPVRFRVTKGDRTSTVEVETNQ